MAASAAGTRDEAMTKEQLEMGKVFVGGLSRDTTTTGLRVYFERFGQISDCVVMKDRSTGAPRGFGFVTYRNQTIADHVVSQRHVIDGKEVEAKPAVPRDSETLLRASLAGPTVAAGLVQSPLSSPAAHPTLPGELKIFVGGLSHETSEVEFVAHFETFGKVTDCVIMCDPHTRKPRGFGFITYDSYASVDRVCANKFHDLNGKRVEVKRAIPQDRMLANPDDGVPSEPTMMRTSSQGRGIGGPGAAPLSGRSPHHPWGRPPFDEAPVQESPVRSTCAMTAALSAANSVLGNSNEVSHQAFHFPGGNFSSATRSLNQGIRTTYGLGSELRDLMPGEGSPYDVETCFSDQQGQQQQLLHQLQEEQLKLQIAQQAFNVQQVKQLQEMQQLVAAQHASSHSTAVRSIQTRMLPRACPWPGPSAHSRRATLPSTLNFHT